MDVDRSDAEEEHNRGYTRSSENVSFDEDLKNLPLETENTPTIKKMRQSPPSHSASSSRAIKNVKTEKKRKTPLDKVQPKQSGLLSLLLLIPLWRVALASSTIKRIRAHSAQY